MVRGLGPGVALAAGQRERDAFALLIGMAHGIPCWRNRVGRSLEVEAALFGYLVAS